MNRTSDALELPAANLSSPLTVKFQNETLNCLSPEDADIITSANRALARLREHTPDELRTYAEVLHRYAKYDYAYRLLRLAERG